jgi:acetolactate synthase small subunit
MPTVTEPTTCLSIVARAEPGLLPRVLELFAKRGMVPSRLHSTVGGRDGRELSIDIEIAGIPQDLASRLAWAARQIVGVELVLASAKIEALSA